MTLRGEQVANAAVIIAEGKKASIPSFGWVVAIAAALQESGLRNLDYGDRDSQGLFQQRPSSGLGHCRSRSVTRTWPRRRSTVSPPTPTTPAWSTSPGWQSMSVAAAAQAVQISALPRRLREVGGRPPGRSSSSSATRRQTLQQTDRCARHQPTGLGECPATGSPAEKGLTPDALLVLRCVKATFPSLTDFGGEHPDPLPDHPSGRAVDLMIPNYQTG